jgi:hypothetical protein
MIGKAVSFEQITARPELVEGQVAGLSITFFEF